MCDLRLQPSASARLADGLRPDTIAQGYDLQSALSLLLEPAKGTCCGHKIGCTTPVMQKFLDINHPCAGRLYTDEVHESGVTLNLQDYVGVGVECEIALRLNQDLAGNQGPHTRHSVAAFVGAVMAAAEIVENRYEDFHEFGIPSLIADDFFSAGAVLGAPVSPNELNLAMVKGTTAIDGLDVGHGLGSAVMGHPYEALAWLANQKCERGEYLKAGDVVMTGSVVETQWIKEPCQVTCRVTPLGDVKMIFV